MPFQYISVSISNRMWRYIGLVLYAVSFSQIGVKASEQEIEPSGEHDLEDSSEKIGPSVTQIFTHPYAASILKNDSYLCSAVILNTYWLVTASKCFDSDIISSYVSNKHLGNFSVRVGSSYNNKGGSINKIKMMINNFDLKVSAVKLETPLVFNSRVDSVRLPNPDDEVTLGYLASIVAWTPDGHIRLVNVPMIESSLCEDYTKMVPGHYICVGGVEDPNRHFCRKDNGGAVIQNDTLVGVASFIHTCAVYTKTHAFPKVASFARWLDAVIWDEGNRPTTSIPTSVSQNTEALPPSTENPDANTLFADPRRFMLTLPFDPINVPLEPAEDNSVIPRMSLYESYLQNLERSRTSTTRKPEAMIAKRDWLQSLGKGMMAAVPQSHVKRYDNYDYN